MNIEELYTEVFHDVQNFNIDDIPGIDLYMDQVTTYLNDKLKMAQRHDDDKLLTKTMINNYVKSHLMPPPEKKKYSKDHLIALILIFFFKNVVSINDVNSILNPIMSNQFADKDDSLEKAFNVYLEHIQSSETIAPIVKSYEDSQKMLEKLNSTSDELAVLSFISVLNYDIFLRKLIIEKIIDSANQEANHTETKEAKKK
ncbi:MAG: DUF1836 domain-containing protein [Eubacterium sp.]|nr:DUF1836 domain-containing protein [Eubacterium sp.]